MVQSVFILFHINTLNTAEIRIILNNFYEITGVPLTGIQRVDKMKRVSVTSVSIILSNQL